MELNDIAKQGMDKVPEFNEFRKDPKVGAFYIFLIIFFIYFIYTEFIKGNDCDKRVEALEKTIVIYQEQRLEDKARISNLEKAFDVQRGIVNVVTEKADSIITGGAK